MSALRLAQIQERVDFWKGVLQLKHVRVDIEYEEADEHDAYATCYPHPHFDSMRIMFRSNLFQPNTTRTVDEVVVHELLHFMFRDYDAAARSPDLNVFGTHVEDLYHERLLHEEESLVDKLAMLIVSLVKA